MTQLKKGLPVYVKTEKLMLMKMIRNKPRDLACTLLYEIVGVEKLINMCALGRNKSRTAVPENIRMAILCE